MGFWPFALIFSPKRNVAAVIQVEVASLPALVEPVDW